MPRELFEILFISHRQRLSVSYIMRFGFRETANVFGFKLHNARVCQLKGICLVNICQGIFLTNNQFCKSYVAMWQQEN